MGPVHRRIVNLVLAITTRPRVTLAIILALLAACVALTLSTLTISSDQNKLFSDRVGFFHNYLDFIHEFPENEACYIVVEPRGAATVDVARWTACADAITARLNTMPQYVVSAACKMPVDNPQEILFDSNDHLQTEFGHMTMLADLTQKTNPLTESTPAQRILFAGRVAPHDTALLVQKLAESWTSGTVMDLRSLSAATPRELGYFYQPNEKFPDRHRILVTVYPQRIFNSLTAVTKTIGAIRDAAQAIAQNYPEFSIGVTGRPALDADQMKTTNEDSHKAEACALITVFILMVIMLRSFWLALAAEIALGVGIGWTFGWATIAFGELNLLSVVFLIALIGIGMDYLVQILMRYRVEARRYQRPSAVWVRVFRHVGPPINTACLGAACAFLVSIFTDFKGAAELGIIAGGGLILCLIAGYTVLPSLLTIFPAKLQPLDASHRYRVPKVGSNWRLIFPAIWVLGLAFTAHFIEKVGFDPGLIKLQVPTLESVKLVDTLQTWSAVVLSKDTNQLRQVRAAVQNLSTVKSTESVLDAQDNAEWLAKNASQIPKISLPAPVTDHELPGIAGDAKSTADAMAGQGEPAAAQALRTFAESLSKPGAAARLTASQSGFISELSDVLKAFQAHALDVDALPETQRSHLRGTDGEYALYIYPAKDLWLNGNANLAEFMTQVESAVNQLPGKPVVTGIASDVFHTTDAIHAAFYHATFYALGLIFILVLLDFRNIYWTLAAISVLAMGLPMLVGLMGLFHVNWNFANFFGLPILIGAGHEYGVFMVHRYLEAKHNPRRAWNRWDPSDRALLLCAIITSGSFAFFWLLAEHQGLKSLGLVMALGTACIYLAAIMILRPLLRWRLARTVYAQAPGGFPVIPDAGK